MRGVLRSGVVGCLTVVVVIATEAHAYADRDCTDFSTQREAQNYFVSLGGPNSDPDRLDADNDGKACDALPCPCGTTPRRPRPQPQAGPIRRPPKALRGRVTRVVDGDTIRVRLRGGRFETVRLIGIDSPESKRPGRRVECGAQIATAELLYMAFTKLRDTDRDGITESAGGQGRTVTLRVDPTQDRRDRYGRLLAYVDGGLGDFGEQQVRFGNADVYVFRRPFRRLTKYRQAQRNATRYGHGVFGSCRGNFHRPLTRAELAPLTGPPTVIRNYSPFDAAGQPVVGVAEDRRGRCDFVGIVRRAYRCFTDPSLIEHPCYPYPSNAQQLLCVDAPADTSGIRVTLKRPIDSDEFPVTYGPWAVWIGQVECTTYLGTHDSVGGYTRSYGCANRHALWGEVDRRTPTWSLRTGSSVTKRITGRVAVSVAWF